MKFRNIKGQFTRFDKRKFLFDSQGDVLYVPNVGFVNEKFIDSTFGNFVKVRKPKVKFKGIKFLGSFTFSDRNKDEDLYDYFKDKKVDKTIKQLQIENKNSVITANVKIKLDNFSAVTTEFKVTDFEAEFLHSNKGREGTKYTSSDAVAFFTHQKINQETDFNLYEFTTDSIRQVEKGFRKNRQKSKGKYAKNQTFEIEFRAVTKTVSRKSHSVGKASENAIRAIKKRDKNKKRS